MTEETISFHKDNEGWGTRYSFIPESISQLNNKLYTFKGGELYVHDGVGNRNEFYGVSYPSKITTVFNQDPTGNKLFKAISIEGSHPWSISARSDIQSLGVIKSEWFEKKEASWFAFLRNESNDLVTPEELSSRSLNGIGQSVIVDATNPVAVVIDFPMNVDIRGSVSCGDIMYHSLPPYEEVLLSGTISAIESDIPNGVNRITVDTSQSILTADILINDPFFLSIKNPTAESGGVRGHYCEVTMENNSTELVEIFTIEAEVMKSFP